MPETTEGTTHPLAGQPAPPAMLIDVGRLEREFLERMPDLSDPRQRVSFVLSGNRFFLFGRTFATMARCPESPA